MAEKYLLRDDETGRYWKAQLGQTTIDAIVQPLVIQLTSIGEKLNTTNALLEEIVDNTTPTIVDVEILGITGLYPDTPDAKHLYVGDEMRELYGELVYSNGKRAALKVSDFTTTNVVSSNTDVVKVGEGGDIYAVDEGISQITYKYNDNIQTTFTIQAKMPTVTEVTQTQYDLAHIAVGDTIDFNTDDLIGTTDLDEEIKLPVSGYGATWTSENNDVLTKQEEGKFYAAKAGTSKLTYTWGEITHDFNATVQTFPEITLFNGGQSFSPDGSNTFTVNKLDGTNFNWYRIKQDGSYLTGKATADGTVLQVIGSENDELNTLQAGAGTFSIAHSGLTKQFNVNVTGNTDSVPKAFLEVDDDETVDLSESPTVSVSSGQVYSGTIYVRNATPSQFSADVSGGVRSGTLLDSFEPDGSSVSVDSGNSGVVRFTATASSSASSGDTAVAYVQIGESEYTINFTLKG